VRDAERDPRLADAAGRENHRKTLVRQPGRKHEAARREVSLQQLFAVQHSEALRVSRDIGRRRRGCALGVVTRRLSEPGIAFLERPIVEAFGIGARVHASVPVRLSSSRNVEADAFTHSTTRLR
jgi:hypothetical protein